MDKYRSRLVQVKFAQKTFQGSPSEVERLLYDALDFCVLPSTGADLVVAAGPAQVKLVRTQASGLRITDTCRHDVEMPWLLSRQRLYVLGNGSTRALAFDLPTPPLETATDLDAIVGSATLQRSPEGGYFLVNGDSVCDIYKLVGGELEDVGSVEGNIYATALSQGVPYAVGGHLRPSNEHEGKPILLDISSGSRFDCEDFNGQLRDRVRREARVSDRYILERLYCDAFLACDARPQRGVRLLAGIAERALPQDLDAGVSIKGKIPGVPDYLGIAHLDLSNGALALLGVDLQHRFIESAQAHGRTSLYVARNTGAQKPLLDDVFVQDDLFGVGHRLQKLVFSGVSAGTPFNKMSIAHREGSGYLAVVNVRWGFEGGKFSPLDIFLTSFDGLHWAFAGDSSL